MIYENINNEQSGLNPAPTFEISSSSLSDLDFLLT